MNLITPVHQLNGIHFKRDDFYMPYGENTVNGGKLRQCDALLDNVKDHGYVGVVSGSSIHSPQSAIVAYSSKEHGLSCTLLFGGTTEQNLQRMPMPRLALTQDPEVKILSTGRHNVLFAKAKRIADENNFYIVDYGMNAQTHIKEFYDTNAEQVQNIPDVDNLVVTCGSGITATGIIYGLHKYGKKIKKLFLVATAPSRENAIKQRLKLIEKEIGEKIEIDYSIHFVDLFHDKGFSYEKGINLSYAGIKFHPNYEAKTFRWLYNNVDFKNEPTLMWIVGSEPGGK